MRVVSITTIGVAFAVGCQPLETPREVMGNFDVSYVDNMRVYINDQLVAEVASGEDATVDYDGESFQVGAVCDDEGTDCPSETFWQQMAVDQPWGPEYGLLNFVNLDLERGTPGQRMGGLLDETGAFTMLSGLAVGGDGGCAALGVGTVEGQFSEDNTEIIDAVIRYAWAGGCSIDGVDIGVSFRLESDAVATRTGDYDVSSVTPEDPIDEEGEPVDPGDPGEGYAVGE